MKRSSAEILREYGPFPGVDAVHGVTFDGQNVWFASGDKLNALDPASGKVQFYGRARARRWMTPPVPGFTTILLLPASLPGD